MTSPLKILVIDNFDSFTYNLVEQFRVTGHFVKVFRNDVAIEIIDEEIASSDNQALLVLSPGPGNPAQAGNLLKILRQHIGKTPILGICLGHQAIVHALGGTVCEAQMTVHGKADTIYVNPTQASEKIFATFNGKFQAARYHSLITKNIPNSLTTIAETRITDREVMAVACEERKLLGFQFHPESILTTHGGQLINQSIGWLTQAN